MPKALGLWVGAGALAVVAGAYAFERTLPARPVPRAAAVAGGTPAAVPVPSQAVAMPATGSLPAADLALVQKIYAAFATGNFVGALTLADAVSLRSDLSQGLAAWLKAQMPVLLVSAGWARLKVGDCDQALTYFNRGAALTPSREAVKGLAICHYKQKNMSAAREHFLSYLEEVPNDEQMLLLFTDVLESDARFTEAVGILKRLVAAASPAAKPALQQRLASMEGREQESVLEQSEASQHFRLTYRGGEQDELAPLVLTTLEEALGEFNEQYGLLPPLTQIEVVLYPKAAFHSVVTNGPAWAEGLFDGRLRIPVDQSSAALTSDQSAELQIVLRHELVHALLALMSDSRSLPPWFDEGLAQRLSCAQRRCPPFAFGPQPGGFLPVQSFLTPYLSLSEVNAGRAYHQSLFLIMAVEARYGPASLRQIITSLSGGGSLNSDALLSSVGGRFDGLYEGAKDFWSRQQLPVGSF